MLMLIIKAGVLVVATAAGAACAIAACGIRADLLDRTQPIHKAAIRGDVVDVGECLAKNVHPDVRSGMQRTGLHYAAYLGRTAVVELLLGAGSNCSLVDYRGASPLHYAAAGGHMDACRLLLDAGARVNARTSSGLTPLHLAAQAGMAGTVQLLLAFGGEVDVVSSGRMTALMLAVCPPRAELLIEELVFQGSWAEPGEQPQQRRVLLDLAQAGASLQARNGDGLTVLDLAARSKDATLMNTVQALRNVTPVRRRVVTLPAARRRLNVQAGGPRRATATQAPAARAAARAAANAAAAQCVVCMEHQRTHACIPCGHMAYCAECVRTLDDHNRRHCCICRARVASICRIYQA